MKNTTETTKLLNSLNRLDEAADHTNFELEEKLQQNRDYNLLFEFIIQYEKEKNNQNKEKENN